IKEFMVRETRQLFYQNMVVRRPRVMYHIYILSYGVVEMWSYFQQKINVNESNVIPDVGNAYYKLGLVRFQKA
ncbi:5702_t:CDS:2, partial [Cetraspora pellucida]